MSTMHTPLCHKAARLLLAALLGVLPALTSCIHDDPQPPVREYVRVGDTLPALSLTLLDSTVADNTLWAGRHLVLVLFSIRCSDCKRELPEVERLYQMVLDRDDVVVLGISRGGGREAVTRFWTEHNLTFPCSPQDDDKVYRLFASSIVPRIYVVDAEGRVVHMYDDSNMPSAETLLDALGI